MRHAGDADLDPIEPVLAALRRLEGLEERKRGIFYRGRTAFLHFHADPAGLFADLKMGGGWRRLRVVTRTERARLVSRAAGALGRGP